MRTTVPFFEEGICDEITECEWLHWLVLLKSVKVDLLLHVRGEGLDVSSEATQSHNDVVLHLEDSLEIVSKGEHLLTESSIGCDPHAVLSHHAHKGASIVLKNRHNLKFI